MTEPKFIQQTYGVTADVATVASSRPNYPLLRKYDSFLNTFMRAIHFGRNQIVYTDNLQGAAKLLAEYVLHCHQLRDGKLDKWDRFAQALGATDKEINTGIQRPGRGGKILEKVVTLDFQNYTPPTPLREDNPWAADSNCIFDFFTKSTHTQRVFREFRVNANNSVFINLCQGGFDYEVFAYGLKTALALENEEQRKKKYGIQIPITFWFVPFEQAALMTHALSNIRRGEGLPPCDRPTEHILLLRPIQTWKSYVPREFAEIDRQREQEGFVCGVSEGIARRVEDATARTMRGLKEAIGREKDVKITHALSDEEVEFVRAYH